MVGGGKLTVVALCDAVLYSSPLCEVRNFSPILVWISTGTECTAGAGISVMGRSGLLRVGLRVACVTIHHERYECKEGWVWVSVDHE
jgi:hypothetical protein